MQDPTNEVLSLSVWEGDQAMRKCVGARTEIEYMLLRSILYIQGMDFHPCNVNKMYISPYFSLQRCCIYGKTTTSRFAHN